MISKETQSVNFWTITRVLYKGVSSVYKFFKVKFSVYSNILVRYDSTVLWQLATLFDLSVWEFILIYSYELFSIQKRF